MLSLEQKGVDYYALNHLLLLSFEVDVKFKLSPLKQVPYICKRKLSNAFHFERLGVVMVFNLLREEVVRIVELFFRLHASAFDFHILVKASQVFFHFVLLLLRSLVPLGCHVSGTMLVLQRCCLEQ